MTDSDYSGLTDARDAVTGPGEGFAALFEALRPYQWPKNAIVFAAFLFSAGEAWRLDEPGEWWPLLWRSGLLLALWCLVSSAVYLVNDVRDRAADALHPRKRWRPVASGRVSTEAALLLAGCLGAGGIALTFALNPLTAVILASYAALMVAYSLGLKDVAILDVIVLSGGVVARAVSGAVAIDVVISPWLYICASFTAFFFASSKRWAEARELGPEAGRHRPALDRYGDDLLAQLLTISAATALLSYALYTIESEHVPRNGAMALTIPFAGFALFRYLLLLGHERRGDAPDRILFTDAQIVVAMAGLAVTAVAVLLYNQ